MKIQTKRNLLRAATATAVVCAAAVVFLPAVASAAPATATSGVNVRSGPGTSYQVIGGLSSGQRVDVQGCRSGWCYINGPTGYVSASYLRAEDTATQMQPNFNLGFSFPQGSVTIGTGNGGSLSIGLGTPSQPTQPDRPVPTPPGGTYGKACFFSGAGYTGQSFCLGSGEHSVYVGPTWNNRISSISNRSHLNVTACNDAGYDVCRTYTTSASNLGSFDNVISSIRVK